MDHHQTALSKEDGFVADRRVRSRSARQKAFVDAARALYEKKGLSRTSIQDITDAVGASRSLFYHYFPDKKAITSAVIDDYVDDFIEAVVYWDESRQEGEIDEALDSVVNLLRMALFENNPFHKALATEENANLYLEFVNRTADRVADFMVARTVRDYAQHHDVEIQHVHETFSILTVGLVAYLRNNPDADNGVLKDVIAQTLHMERNR